MKLDIKAKLNEYRRVLRIARKPNKDEFVASSKICALGMVVIGFIGFVIFIAFLLIGI